MIKKLGLAATLAGAVLAFAGAVLAGEDAIEIGAWRTEAGKSLVCGGQEVATIATRANDFYASGAKKVSAEYEAYWSFLEKAFHERRCFVTAGMRHIPDSIVYTGPEHLETQGKRFKVVGTTIEENGERYPAFMMTTRKVKPQ